MISLLRPISAAFTLLFAMGGMFIQGSTAEQDVTPGKSSKSRGGDVWTLEGELQPAPVRISETLPLSDQSNVGEWSSYEPLTDEFSGAALDDKKWLPYHPRWKGRQPAWFSPENVKVSEGQLQLIMRKDDSPEKLRTRGYHTYSSASVHATDRVKYGYFEVRAKPMDSGGSSSFWFAGSDRKARTEIDVFELGGKVKGHERRYNMNLHVFYSPKSKEHWSLGGHYSTTWRVADDFHVYGLNWSKDTITYFIDGQPVRRVENTDWHQPLFMIFDSETMPKWFGLPKDEDLPSTFRIDYVRCWKSNKQKVANKQVQPATK